MDTKKEDVPVTNTTHTPGPWIFYADLPSVEPNWHIVTTANKMRVLANVHIEPGNDTDKANARLIAAAPELLEALPEMVNMARAYLAMCPDRRGHDVAAIERAEAAIAKAEGRTNG